MSHDAQEATPPTGNAIADEANARLRAFQDGIPHLAWTARVDGSIDYVNVRWREYTGRTFDELCGWGWLEVLHPDDRYQQEADWRRTIQSGERYEQSLRVRRHDGVYRWHALRDWPTRDHDGRITQWFGTATDIEDQRLWEDRLRIANAELEQFASIAAHDLQEPLRMVTNYVGLLKRQYKAGLDDRANEYISTAVDGADRMKGLIVELLEFARVGNASAGKEEASGDRALAEALVILRERIEKARGEVHSGSLPVVNMKHPHLVRLMQNLVGNGLKYHRPDLAPRVHVDASREAGGWVFSVADNGIGIGEDDRARVFEVFTRLHTRSEFPGTGLGLAICKKLVAVYRGRIWVEEADGGGSVFKFSIPDAPSREEAK